MILILDNYDSFTYNIYQYITGLGYQSEVIRNDVTTTLRIAERGYDAIILSPGPGTPGEAGITKAVVREFAGKIPILGVCLGHQAIAEAFGGAVVRAPQPVHGKVSGVYHDGNGIYAGIPSPLPAGRYHSLIVERASLPQCLAVTGETDDGIIMSIKHRRLPVEGVQFHPESILTTDGIKLFANFLSAVCGCHKNKIFQE